MALTKGLLEVILYAEDMAAMVAFYRDVLELAVTFPANAHDFAREMWVTFDTGGCTLALHGGGQKHLSQERGEVVFLVDDVHAARATLAARGVAMGEVATAAPGITVCSGRDPEGNRFAVESRQ
jgi:predicted enzyme related to lactoylglutathione lyase